MTPHAPPTDRNNFRLLIIDPSYATRTGHNHAVNSLLLSEARRRGIESYVFAHTSLAASSEIIPAFRPTAYGYSPQDSIDALLHSHAIGKAFAEDLAAYVQPRLKPADILFAHTLHNPLMHGFAAWLASLSAPHDICVRLGLNLPPDFRQRRQDVASWNAHQYAFAFRLLTAVAPATRFYAETRELEALFLSLGAQPTAHRRLPLRVIMANRDATPSQPRDRLIYFIPGEIRAEKGHEFLINGVLQFALPRSACLNPWQRFWRDTPSCLKSFRKRPFLLSDIGSSLLMQMLLAARTIPPTTACGRRGFFLRHLPWGSQFSSAVTPA
jgi:hypothetical protein